MALQTKNVKGLSPKNDNKELSPDVSVNCGNNNNAPKYGTVIPNRIFVGGISPATTEADLTQLFSNYGRVTGTKIIADRAGVSKGYGFVTFETEEEAKRLQKDAENIILRERRLNIAPAVKKQGFGRAFEPAGGNISATPPAGATQLYHPNGIPYYHNGMAFFPPGSASASVTPMPSAPVDPALFSGPYTTAAPHMTTYAPPMIYQAPVYFQNQYPQYQVPYDGCYTLGEGQGATMILQNGGGDNGGSLVMQGGTSQYFVSTTSGGGGGQQGGVVSPPGGGGSTPQQGAQVSSTPPHVYAPDLTTAYTLHQMATTAAPYTCMALPQDPTGATAPPPIIHYAMARRPYEHGIIEVRQNDRNGMMDRCYSHHGDMAAVVDGSNDTTAKPDSTADVTEKRGPTPVVSLLKLETEEELQMKHQQQFTRPNHYPNKNFIFSRSNRGKQYQLLNNNNPEVTNRNLAKFGRCGNNIKQGGGHTPASPPPPPPSYSPMSRPPMLPFLSDNTSGFNLPTSSLQVPQFPYYTSGRPFYNPAMPSSQQRRLSNPHRRQNVGGNNGRGSRYRGGSHNSSRSSSQGRGQGGGCDGSVTTEGSSSGCGGVGGGGDGGEGGGTGALTPPTTPRCSPHDTSPPPSSSVPANSASITRSIQALSL